MNTDALRIFALYYFCGKIPSGGSNSKTEKGRGCYPAALNYLFDVQRGIKPALPHPARRRGDSARTPLHCQQ